MEVLQILKFGLKFHGNLNLTDEMSEESQIKTMEEMCQVRACRGAAEVSESKGNESEVTEICRLGSSIRHESEDRERS